MNEIENQNKIKKEVISLPTNGILTLDSKIQINEEQFLSCILLKKDAPYYIKQSGRIINFTSDKEQELFLKRDLFILDSEFIYFNNLSVYDNLKFYIQNSKKSAYKKLIADAISFCKLERYTHTKISDLPNDMLVNVVLAKSIIAQSKTLLVTNSFFQNYIKNELVVLTLEKLSENSVILVPSSNENYFKNHNLLSQQLLTNESYNERDYQNRKLDKYLTRHLTSVYLKSSVTSIISLFLILLISFLLIALSLNKIDQAVNSKLGDKHPGSNIFFSEKDARRLRVTHRDFLDENKIKFDFTYNDMANIRMINNQFINDKRFDNVRFRRLKDIWPNNNYDDKQTTKVAGEDSDKDNDSKKSSHIVFSWDFTKYYKVGDTIYLHFLENGKTADNNRHPFEVKGFYRFSRNTVYLPDTSYYSFYRPKDNNTRLHNLAYFKLADDDEMPRKYHIEIDDNLNINELSYNKRTGKCPLKGYLMNGGQTDIEQYVEKIQERIGMLTYNPRIYHEDDVLYISPDVAQRVEKLVTDNFREYIVTNPAHELPKIYKLMKQHTTLDIRYDRYYPMQAIHFFIPILVIIQTGLVMGYFMLKRKSIVKDHELLLSRHLNKHQHHFLLWLPYIITYGIYIVISLTSLLLAHFIPNYYLDFNIGCLYSSVLLFLLGFTPFIGIYFTGRKKLSWECLK